MPDTTTTITTSSFTLDAMTRIAGARSNAGNGAIGTVRERAFAEFGALPMPSPETEEWRYTDLRELDLAAYDPSAVEPIVRNWMAR